MKTAQQLACVLAIVALTVEVHGRSHFEECQSDPDSHVDVALLQKGLRGELADQTPIGPHALCMNVKRGFQDQNGDINAAALRTYLSDVRGRNSSLVDQVVAECGHRNGTTAQKAALALLNCIHRIIPHEEDHQKCPTRNEIDEDKYFEALKGAPNQDALLDRYVFCNNLKDGIQNRNGDVSADGIRAYLTDGPRHNITAVDIIVRECGQRKGVTIQETAWAVTRCIHHHVIAMEPEHV